LNYRYKNRKARKIEIKNILIFFNNFRGLKLSQFLIKKDFKVFKIVTKKFLNKKILYHLKNNVKIIKNLKSENLKDFIIKKKFDLIISAGFPHIFKKDYLKLSKYGIINLHAGRLPKYRGGSPLVWQIINGEKNIGLSIIKVNQNIDEGKIIVKTQFKNDTKKNIFDFQKKANKLFLNLTYKAIKKIIINKKLLNQPLSQSYYKQRSDKDALINFNNTNVKVYDFVRAQSYPYKGAYFFNSQKKFRLFKCSKENFNPKINSGKLFKFQKRKDIYIKCKKNSVKILSIIPNIKLLKNINLI